MIAPGLLINSGVLGCLRFLPWQSKDMRSYLDLSYPRRLHCQLQHSLRSPAKLATRSGFRDSSPRLLNCRWRQRTRLGEWGCRGALASVRIWPRKLWFQTSQVTYTVSFYFFFLLPWKIVYNLQSVSLAEAGIFISSLYWGANFGNLNTSTSGSREGASNQILGTPDGWQKKQPFNCLEGKSMTTHWGNTILFRSS